MWTNSHRFLFRRLILATEINMTENVSSQRTRTRALTSAIKLFVQWRICYLRNAHV